MRNEYEIESSSPKSETITHRNSFTHVSSMSNAYEIESLSSDNESSTISTYRSESSSPKSENNSASTPRRPCLNCRRVKRGCDRGKPCGRCKKRGLDCIYEKHFASIPDNIAFRDLQTIKMHCLLLSILQSINLVMWHK